METTIIYLIVYIYPQFFKENKVMLIILTIKIIIIYNLHKIEHKKY